MLKLLIAEPQEDVREALTEYLAGEYEICVSRHGYEALEMMCTVRPDLVIFELMQPELEGISVLQRAADQGIRPKVLATTRFISEYAVQALTQLKIDYLVAKPFELRAMADRLRDFACALEETPPIPERDVLVSNALQELGVRAKLKGSLYLRKAVPMAMDNPDYMITKDIYPEVAAVFGISTMQVERSIRSCIEKAYDRGNMHVWARYFPSEPDGRIRCPSNGEFICALAARLSLAEKGRNG